MNKIGMIVVQQTAENRFVRKQGDEAALGAAPLDGPHRLPDARLTPPLCGEENAADMVHAHLHQNRRLLRLLDLVNL